MPGEENQARPGWTTSRRGQDSPWKSQSERQGTDKWRKYVQPSDRRRLKNRTEVRGWAEGTTCVAWIGAVCVWDLEACWSDLAPADAPAYPYHIIIIMSEIYSAPITKWT